MLKAEILFQGLFREVKRLRERMRERERYLTSKGGKQILNGEMKLYNILMMIKLRRKSFVLLPKARNQNKECWDRKLQF